MVTVKLKIDVSGTLGDEAWRNLRQFDQIQSASFGPQFGVGSSATTTKAASARASQARAWGASSNACQHPANVVHPAGEWVGAEVRVDTPLMAQYAVAHYLRQDRVLDADVLE